MDRPALLTERETAVLELVGEGLTSNEIADRLGIARPTVESHIGAAMRKLGARTRRQAALMIR
jgi:DNA-binding CsgD family transcriptional regulator